MFENISRSDVADLRAVLRDADYSEAGLTGALGSATPPTQRNAAVMLYRSRVPNALNALSRLFLIGASLEENAINEVLPRPFVDMCLHTGLLEKSDGRVRAGIAIVPIDNLLFASDAFRKMGTESAVDFVLPASTRATSYLRRLTMRERVASTLDLGCGCGVHALLAAEHSDSVVATDISQSALQYTEFNLLLNAIDNVQCLQGDAFEPVTGSTFDRVISNPPFIVGPTSSFTYRDNPLDLDDFCRQLVREAPVHLNEDGCLQMLCEWVEIEGQPWQERLSDWFAGTGCDAWVLRSPPRGPLQYVERRVTDVSGEGVDPGTTIDDWLRYLEDRDVRAVHPGMIVLRRRSGDNWFHIHSQVAEPEDELGPSIARNLAACDFLQLCEDDDTLLQAILAVSPDLELEQRFSREDDGWTDTSAMLRMRRGLSMDTEVDLPILAFFSHVDGRRPLRDCIGSFCDVTGAESATLTPQLLPAVRLFIANGFIEGVEPE